MLQLARSAVQSELLQAAPEAEVLVQRIAHSRNLSAEQVGEIARQECGKSVPQLDRQGMSHLLETLMSEEARS